MGNPSSKRAPADEHVGSKANGRIHSEVMSWSSSEVLQWLASLGEGYKDYTEKFKQNGVDGQALFDLDADILKQEFGITNAFHIKRILRVKDGRESLTASATEIMTQDLRKIERVAIEFNTLSTDSSMRESMRDVGICRRIVCAFSENGVNAPEPIVAVLKAVDEVLTTLIEQRIPLDSADYMANRVINTTAALPVGCGVQGRTSILDTAKADHAAIQNGQVATRTACIKVRTAVQVLTMKVQGFSDVALKWRGGHVCQEERSEHEHEIKKALATFVDGLEQIAAAAELGGQDMLARAQKQMQSLTAGSEALQRTIKVLAEITVEREETASAYRKIMEERPFEVQLALEGRAGCLKKRRDDLLSEIDDLKKERTRMEKLIADKDTILAKHEEFVRDVNRKDQEHRDWHIRCWWARLWGPEMDTYRQQADRSLASSRQEAERAEELQDLYRAKIEKVRMLIDEKSDQLQNMSTMLSERAGKPGWLDTLESRGVLALEDRMKDARDRASNCEVLLRRAMQETGIQDPKGAANAILMHHQALLLLADSAKKGQILAQFIKGLGELTESYVHSVFTRQSVSSIQKFACNLQILPKGLAAIQDFHMEQQRYLDKPDTRMEAIAGYVTRMQREFDPQQSFAALK